MKLSKKIIVGTIVGTAVGLAAILSTQSIFRNNRNETAYSIGCETYQGYRIGPDGEIFLVFDEKTAKERGNEIPNYIFLGEPGEIDENRFEIGKLYRLEIKKGLTIGSFQQCTDSEQKNQGPK